MPVFKNSNKVTAIVLTQAKNYLSPSMSTFSILHHLIAGLSIASGALKAILEPTPRIPLTKEQQTENNALNTLPFQRYGDAVQQNLSRELYLQRREMALTQEDWTYPHKTLEQKNQLRHRYNESIVQKAIYENRGEQNRNLFFNKNNEDSGNSFKEIVNRFFGKD